MENKLIKVCENLLFTDTKITIGKFKKELRKENIKIFHSIAERIVAFLNVLPKNLALFHALEPTFKYILQDQFNLDDDEQRYVFIIEKLQNKQDLEEYELVAATQMYFYYPDMFTKKFFKKLQKEEKNHKISYKERMYPLIRYFADLWYDFNDKKEYNYYIILKDGSIFNSNRDFKNFKEMYEEIMELAESLSGSNIIENFEVNKLESYILFEK